MMYLSKNKCQESESDWIKGKSCPCEGDGEINPLTYDHIIPKHLILMFGINPDKWFDEENGQALCFRCNQFKNHQLDFTNPKTKPLLLKYIDLIN